MLITKQWVKEQGACEGGAKWFNDNYSKDVEGAEVVETLIKDKEIAKVSVVGIGMRSHSGVVASMFEALADNVTSDDIIKLVLSRVPVPAVPLRERNDGRVRA